MSLSALPPFLATCLARLAASLHARSAARLPLLLVGLLLARGRRTVTSWFRAAHISADFRRAYNVVWACGRRGDRLAGVVWSAVEPLVAGRCLRLALDDTPTRRWGPHIEGAGRHHNPNPGPAGEAFLWGHLWVTLAALRRHPRHGTSALPLFALPYVRQKDCATMPPDRRVGFRTKLQLAGDLLRWLADRIYGRYQRVEVAVDGGYAKRPFLRQAKQLGVVVFSRLRRDAALWDLPGARPPGTRGRPRIYGTRRLSLAKRAGQTRGWQHVECFQYGQRVTKTIKTFVATWRPVQGPIRVVLVKEDHDWLAYFCTDTQASAADVLEMMADRGAIEQTFKDVKEVWGAEQQQVRNFEANKGCFNLNLWMYSLTEAWARDKEEDELVDRRASPWDSAARRPSHADKRKALQRQVLHQTIREVLLQPSNPENMTERLDALLQLAL